MKLSEKIHTGGQKLYSYPFRVYFLECEGDEEPQRIFSVPKKIFKRAVKRNLVRRRTKEAFRHVSGGYPVLETRHIMLVYTATDIMDYGKIREGLEAVLEKIG